MSRVGKQPTLIPEKVKAVIQGREILVEGPLGRLTLTLPVGITAETDPKEINLKRENDERSSRSTHGLARALIANMVRGVSKGFKRKLELSGVG